MTTNENEKRVLKINPNLFSISGKTNSTRKREPKAPKPAAVPKIRIKTASAPKPPKQPKPRNDTLKKKSILNMIRKQQQEKYKTLFEEAGKSRAENNTTSLSEPAPNTDFQEATAFLQNLSKKVAATIPATPTQISQHNHTIKRVPDFLSAPLPHMPPHVPLHVPPHAPVPLFAEEQEEWYEKLPPVPLPISNVGCLKNGRLPTYRNYMNKTRSNNPAILFGVGKAADPLPIKDTSALEQQLDKSMERVRMIQKNNSLAMKLPPKKLRKQKKIKRRTHKIGKSKTAPKISVLVSNKTIRSQITTKSQLLKQTPLAEVKQFLVKHGMIKIGSIAPNDVLRKMYESAVLMCGEVYNHNRDTILYNFIHGTDK